MKRGKVWIANLNPPRGHEAGKTRPVLIALTAEEMETVERSLRVVLGCSELAAAYRSRAPQRNLLRSRFPETVR
jgi:hypothetical protein